MYVLEASILDRHIVCQTFGGNARPENRAIIWAVHEQPTTNKGPVARSQIENHQSKMNHGFHACASLLANREKRKTAFNH